MASTGGLKSQTPMKKKAKNGTAEIGIPVGTDDSDKRVLHSKTDRLSAETEELYEDFDPRVEYSRTDKPDDAAEPAKKGTEVLVERGTAVLMERGTAVLEERGTAVLVERGTAVLHEGTALLEDTAARGTCLLEEEVEPVKFTVTRNYIVVHSEEGIL